METRAIYWESETNERYNYSVEVLAVDGSEMGIFFVRTLRVRKYLNTYETWRNIYLDRVILNKPDEAKAIRQGITDLDFLMGTWDEDREVKP